MRLLLVEDAELLGEGIETGLRQAGYTVDWLQDGDSALTALLSDTFDLVLLDLGLPKRNGLEVLREIRAAGKTLPVLILTAQGEVESRVEGLDAGADDYLVKPFDLEELYARLRALLRRHSGRVDTLLKYADIELDPAAHEVKRAGERVDLSRREFAVLHTLLENTGRVMSRDRLEQSLYGWGEEVESNAVEVYVHHLRKKFGNELIRTIRGVGYMIDKTAN